MCTCSWSLFLKIMDVYASNMAPKVLDIDICAPVHISPRPYCTCVAEYLNAQHMLLWSKMGATLAPSAARALYWRLCNTSICWFLSERSFMKMKELQVCRFCRCWTFDHNALHLPTLSLNTQRNIENALKCYKYRDWMTHSLKVYIYVYTI